MFIFLMVINLNAEIPSRTYAIAPAEPNPIAKIDIRDQAAVKSFVAEKARQAGVNPNMALWIIEPETSYEAAILSGAQVGDGQLICRETNSPNFGKHERARGPWQINDCYNWNVPDKIANDLKASTEWAMPIMRRHPERWSTYADWLNEQRKNESKI